MENNADKQPKEKSIDEVQSIKEPIQDQTPKPTKEQMKKAMEKILMHQRSLKK